MPCRRSRLNTGWKLSFLALGAGRPKRECPEAEEGRGWAQTQPGDGGGGGTEGETRQPPEQDPSETADLFTKPPGQASPRQVMIFKNRLYSVSHRFPDAGGRPTVCSAGPSQAACRAPRQLPASLPGSAAVKRQRPAVPEAPAEKAN